MFLCDQIPLTHGAIGWSVFCDSALRIGESQSNCPFLTNNGHEAVKGPSVRYFSGIERYWDFLILTLVCCFFC